MKKTTPKIKADWLSKTLAGSLLGLALGIAVSGLFAWFGPGALDAPNKHQFTIWLVAPVWMAVLGFCFLFQSGLRAWLWLGSASLLAFGLLYTARQLPL